MMRAARRLPLLVVFCLLTSAATAYAECAWVLWEDTTWPTNKITTEPIRAYPTKPECDRGLSEILATFKSNPVQSVQKDMMRQEAYVTTGKSTVGYRYVCLPDTVDPRGASR